MALKKKVQISDNLFLNIAIGITGICLLGFIYSFSQNAASDGVPVNVTFQNSEDLTLAVDIYEKKPIKNIDLWKKLDFLNNLCLEEKYLMKSTE